MKFKSTISLALLLATVPAFADVDELKLDFHGAGWLQAGRVENSFALENAGNDYEKNWLGQSGGLLTIHSQIDEHWDGALGLGTVLVHLARGSKGISNKWYPFWVSFVDEARITHSSKLGDADLKINLGNFHYGYNPDSKNMGQYLVHGYVYPGTIVTNFTGPLGVNQTISGIQAALSKGGFKNDLNLQVETDDKPLYDISLSDVVAWRPHPAFEIGAGVNFYRLIPTKSKATSPGKDCDPNLLGVNAIGATDSPCFIIEKDTAGNAIDTVLASLAGIKLMGRFRLDFKALFGAGEGSLGKNDLVLYGEAAVLGVKDYPRFYDKIARRIPVMVGFNLPGFGLFDWSVEGEYYAAKNSSNNLAAKNGSPIPVQENAKVNNARDDIKWSVNASRMLGGNFILLGQVANDHLRLGGNHDEDTGIEAMRTPDDWYWTTKIAYFF
jgi:hypothetical protein